MQTYLQITNEVLARLREASVSTVSETTYSTLISKLVNQVKREIEDAYPWNAMRDTYAVATVANTSSYSFTGAGDRAQILDGWDTTTPAQLTEGTNAEFNSFYFGSTSIQTGSVTKYIAAGLSADYDLKIDVLPMPNGVYNLKFNIYKPQADLSADADVPLCPQTVLIEETIARAKIERGDDDAPKPTMPGDSFICRELLQTAITRDSGYDDSETDWQVE